MIHIRKFLAIAALGLIGLSGTSMRAYITATGIALGLVAIWAALVPLVV